VRWRSWKEDGQPDEDGQLDETGDDAKELARNRKRIGRQCDREDLPTEFRPDAFDWDSPPTPQPLPPARHPFPPPAAMANRTAPPLPRPCRFPRISSAELAVNGYDEEGRKLYRGKPFTGMVYRERKGVLIEESFYRDGWLWGTS